ncbi:hypothetical protein ACLFMI_11805 [Pseudonocardia nantongensis]|uniref:hypothetical protein n=1 Tax=Pseudonocardia nantongensis TaxID=1181885 RepID=UPI003978DA51
MIIDCDRCEARGDACGSCVIGVLMDVHEDDRPIPYLPVDRPGADLDDARAGAGGPGVVPTAAPQPVLRPASGGPASGPVEFAEPERRALQVLAEQGLIPHLRLVETGPAGPEGAAAAPLLPVPTVPGREARHRDAG